MANKNPYQSPGDPVPEKRMEAQTPIAEPRSDWIPYRGHEQHGVMQPAEIPIPLPDEDFTDDIAAEIDEEIKNAEKREAEANPVPVTIIFDKRPRTDIHYRTSRMPLPADNATLIAGRDDRRTQLKIKVVSGSCSIMEEISTPEFLGYPLNAGDEIETTSVEEVYAIGTAANTVVATLAHFVVNR